MGNFLSQSLGTRFVCEDLAAALQAAGWSVVTTSQKLNRASRMLDMLSTIWKERKAYEVANVDVYSGPSFLWAEVACRALTLLGKAYILTLHGGNLPVFARRWPGRVRRLLKGAVKVVAPSPYLLHELKGYRRDLLMIPNTIDLHAYHFRDRVHPEPSLIWLRAFETTYNPLLAPRVLASLVQEFPRVHLTMIGPDKGDGSLQTLQHLIGELKLAGSTTILGKVPKSEVNYWLDRGDIFINTTNFDNTPVSVLEALASGLCVVSTDVGGLPYLLEHGEDALLVPPDDPAAMAAQVRRLLVEPALAGKISRRARKKAELFDRRAVFPRWEALFDEVSRS